MDQTEVPFEAPANKDSSSSNTYGSDFSVSTRLLSSPQNTNTSFMPAYHHHQSPATATHYNNCPVPPSWQFMLPSDVGTARNSHSAAHYTAPNASLSMIQPPPYSSSHSVINGHQLNYDQFNPTRRFVQSDSQLAPPLHHKADHALPMHGQSWNQQGYQLMSNSNTKKALPSHVDALTSPSTSSYPNTPQIKTPTDTAPMEPAKNKYSLPVKEEKGSTTDTGDEDSGSEDDSDTNSATDKDSEPKKPKRTRTAYSNSQLDQLELIFSTTHYPDVFTREDLSRRLGIKEDRIQASAIQLFIVNTCYNLGLVSKQKGSLQETRTNWECEFQK
jgi:hypothetical protein